MAAEKTTKDNGDQAIAWAEAEATRAQKTIAFLRKHQLGDAAKLPPPRSSKGQQSVCLLGEKDLRAMSHDELIVYAMKLEDVIVHMAHMMMNADAQRIATGVHYNRKTLEAIGLLAGLGEQVRKAKADRKRGAAVRDENNGTAAKQLAVKAEWTTYGKRGRGTKTRFMTAQAVKHKVSPRTIERWIAGK